jgi:hypothetical protein
VSVRDVHQSFTLQPDTFWSSDKERFVCVIDRREILARWPYPMFPGGRTAMSTEIPAALAGETREAGAKAAPVASGLAETALTVLFTAAAVLFISFVAVVTGLV